MPVLPPDRTRSRRGQRRSELRRVLMSAVETELDAGATMGELSVERLVQTAGVSRSSFYVYFEDRGDLLQQWFASVVDEITQPTQSWWDLGPEVSRADLHRVIDAIARAYRPHARVMAATFDAATDDPALRTMTDGFIVGSARDLRKHIRAGQTDGWIDPAISAEQTSLQLTWLAERIFHQMLPGASDRAVGAIVDSHADIVFKTLYLVRAADV